MRSSRLSLSVQIRVDLPGKLVDAGGPELSINQRQTARLMAFSTLSLLQEVCRMASGKRVCSVVNGIRKSDAGIFARGGDGKNSRIVGEARASFRWVLRCCTRSRKSRKVRPVANSGLAKSVRDIRPAFGQRGQK